MPISYIRRLDPSTSFALRFFAALKNDNNAHFAQDDIRGHKPYNPTVGRGLDFVVIKKRPRYISESIF